MNQGRRIRERVAAIGASATVLALTLSGCTFSFSYPSLDREPNSATEQPDSDPGRLGDGAERFTDQSIEWVECLRGFECADVFAPLDWDDPGGDTITLRLVKQPATGRGEKIGTLFVNPGGPGSGGASFVAESIDYAVGDDLQRDFDVIGWDPRGVGDSTAVYCYDDAGMDELLYGDPRAYADLERGSDEWIEQLRADSREYGETCLTETGPLLGHVSTLETVYDLDLLRHLVGDDELNYLGFSYGTFIGATYAETFPERVGRLVLDGAIAPDVKLHDVILHQQQGFEASARTYLAECLTREGCPFSGTVEGAMRQIGALIDRVDRVPLQAPDGRWVSSGTFITAIILPLYNESNWWLLDDLFAEVRRGETERALFLADIYNGRGYAGYDDNSTVAFTAINCLDYPPAVDVETMRREAAEIAKAAPVFGRYAGFGGIQCQEWPFDGPAERGPVTASGAAPILVLGTTGDPATPYVWSKQLADQLESGVLVTYNGEGHGAYTTGNACIDSTVEQYFLEGAVPSSDPNC